MKVEYVIHREVEKLCKRLEEWKGREPLNINYAYAAVTSDIVSTYLFARPYGVLDTPDFDPKWFVCPRRSPALFLTVYFREDVTLKIASMAHLFNHFTFIQP